MSRYLWNWSVSVGIWSMTTDARESGKERRDEQFQSVSLQLELVDLRQSCQHCGNVSTDCDDVVEVKKKPRTAINLTSGGIRILADWRKFSQGIRPWGNLEWYQGVLDYQVERARRPSYLDIEGLVVPADSFDRFRSFCSIR